MTAMGHVDLTLRAFSTLTYLFNAKVLDVGCGDLGYTRGYFLTQGFQWLGIDKNFEDKEQNIFKCEMEDIKIVPDNSIDLVFVCHSLEHSEQPIKALKEFRRVLKLGGYLFISMPLHCEKQILGGDEDHISVFSQMQMKRLFAYTGIRLLDFWVEKQFECRDSQNTQIFVGIKMDKEVTNAKPNLVAHSNVRPIN